MYQLVFTDEAGRIRLAEDQECVDEIAALTFGKRFMKDHHEVEEVEIWEGQRRVGGARRSKWSDPIGGPSAIH